MTLTFIIAVIVFAVVVLVLLNLVAKPAVQGIDKAHFIHEWNDIVAMSKDEKTYSTSVMSADKLLDEALKGLGYKGETMAERMVAAKNRLKNKDELWRAHKVRNQIVHESKFKINEKQVKQALWAYQRAFKDLGVI
ncbi:MAG: hypothetical protein MUF85_02730 [Patescibacteria group bacterium]|jgi:hypothetical protein|nr:hypothetical protein [Patescibacteria group bacterium]